MLMEITEHYLLFYGIIRHLMRPRRHVSIAVNDLLTAVETLIMFILPPNGMSILVVFALAFMLQYMSPLPPLLENHCANWY